MTTFTGVVELFVSGAWLDITEIDDETKVLRDGSLTITRGRSDQQGRVAPTEVRFNYLDNQALLDGDNPLSPYYRLIGLGTPLRVTVDGDVRAVVEIVSWEPSWDDVDSVVMVSVVGAGLLRRIEDGQKPLRSPAYRALTSADEPNRVAYWPIEEESEATQIFSPYGNVSAFVGVRLGAYTASPATPRMATFEANGTMFFPVPFYNGPQHKVVSLWTLPETPLAGGTILFRLYCTGGNVDTVDLEYAPASAVGHLQINAYFNGSLIDTANNQDFSAYILNQHFALSLEFEQDGADTATTIYVINTDSDGASTSESLAGVTFGRIYAISAGMPHTNAADASFGQLAVGNALSAFATFLEPISSSVGAVGFNDEFAGDRIGRIADEEMLPVTVSGNAEDTERVGVQGADTSTGLVFTAADTDQGILLEDRTALGLTYRTRASLYNQTPTAELSYGHLAKGFRPTGDDLRVTNSVTVQRDGGGTGMFAIPDGDWWHWSTEDPPDGAYLREAEVPASLGSDSQTVPQAGWIAHLGSWREKRFRQVGFELAHPNFTAGNRTAVRALDIGDVLAVDVTGAPAYVPYDEIRLMVQGYTETVSRYLHTFVFNTTPADVYEVEVVDGDSTIVVAIDDNDTSLKLATSLGPEWSTADEPYHLQVDGDPVTVTTMVTDTPAFIAAGTAAHANNASVTPGMPAGITANQGQLLLAFVAIRNSGTGTVDEHGGGWTTLVDLPGVNLKIFYRYYVTGDTAPTFGFSGGVANADTSAQIAAFSGLSHEFASGTKAEPTWASQLNGSAQNIAYPGVAVHRAGGVKLWFGWKQDDWTSVTGPGDAEIGEPDTVTGDDQGIAWYYDIYTTASDVASGSFTVTGGLSAISRSVVLALRPLQTATVTRGIAGTATSHAVGDPVHVWRPGVTGL